MRLPVFLTATLLTHALLVLSGPLSVRKEIRDVAQDYAWFQPFFEALNTQRDTPTIPESPSDPDVPVMGTSFVPLTNGLGSSMYAALGGGQSDTPAFPELQSELSTGSTSPANLNIPTGFNDNSYSQLSTSTPGSGSSLDSFGGSATTSQPGNELPGVGSSFQIATSFPEDLERDVGLIAQNPLDVLVCTYTLDYDQDSNYDRDGLHSDPDHCSGRGGWSEFKETEVGFVLYRAPGNRILSLMNYLHDGYREVFTDAKGNHIWEKRYRSDLAHLFRRSDKYHLQRLKREWNVKVESFMPTTWTLKSVDGIKDEKTFMDICYYYFNDHTFCAKGLPQA
ncbi:hypothetical protein MMC07_004801 [Pseudocyphellaria aurata]|nr:hypothetical protein [Pseudocyphellaria aurata]